jgi:glycosyltransferase involved in cell wall biosynthesis
MGIVPGNILFSIIIPTYNRAKFLENTLRSLLLQGYPNFEIIVVDDGGHDDSDKVAKSFSDHRIKYFWKENGERGAARNYGASLANGDYLNFFDSDDIAYPNHLETALTTIQNFNLPEVFHLAYDIKLQNDKLIHKVDKFNGDIISYGIKKKKISPHSLFIRKDVTKLIKFYEDRALTASEDAVYLCQLAARFTIYYNNTITATLVEHDKRSMNLATETELLQRRDSMLEILRNDIPFMEKYGSYLKDIKKEFDYLLTLSCLIKRDHKSARRYYWSYMSSNFFGFWDKRTFVFIKQYLNAF